MTTSRDRDLGMDRPMDRRDFMNGLALAATGLMVSPRAAAATPATANPAQGGAVGAWPSGDYPPSRTGLRGQYPGSFEEAHRVRDGAYAGDISGFEDTGERYDLVVVGAGISGLAAAYFFREALGHERRVLVLDNHDDFGGHAKRNEFHHGGRLYLAAGGTLDIDTPYPYSYGAKALLRELGIDVASYPRHLDSRLYQGMGDGVFFDREHFLGDRVVAGYGKVAWPEFFASAPLAEEVRSDLRRLHAEAVDFLPDLDPGQKAALLKRISYQDFLLQHARIVPQALPFFSGHAYRNNKRMDTCPAYEAARYGSPGFAGMHLDLAPVDNGGFFFHFPDGNATVARLLANRLVPEAWGQRHDMESISTAAVAYARLDAPGNTTRIRLESTVVRVRHDGDVGGSRTVSVFYVCNGRIRRLQAANVILACPNNIVRFLIPELPEPQKAALAYASKVPMQYTNVLLRNWTAWRKLGVQSILAPNGYHTELELVPPVSLGAYRFPAAPNSPVIARLTRNPNHPGLPRKEQQRLGRAEMLATSFESIEREVRTQLARILGPAGFDPASDILALTVNRWPHGYAYTYDTLADSEFADAERPHVVGRQRFGRISIANADAGAAAFTNEAIDQAERAVHDALISRGLL